MTSNPTFEVNTSTRRGPTTSRPHDGFGTAPAGLDDARGATRQRRLNSSSDDGVYRTHGADPRQGAAAPGHGMGPPLQDPRCAPMAAKAATMSGLLGAAAGTPNGIVYRGSGTGSVPGVMLSTSRLAPKAERVGR